MAYCILHVFIISINGDIEAKKIISTNDDSSMKDMKHFIFQSF